MRISKSKTDWVHWVIIGFFALVALIMILPLWSAVVISLADIDTFSSGGIMLLPKNISLDAYRYIVHTPKIYNALWVSIKVTVLGTALNMFATFTYAYAISLQDLPGRKFFITVALVPMFFNAGLIPLYMTVKAYGLVDKIWSMILPTAINIWYLMLIKNHFVEMPSSIREAAMLDGANEAMIFSKVMLPISKPIIATFFLFYAVERWNEWFYSNIFISTSGQFTLQKVLRDIIVNTTTATSSMTSSFQAASGGYVASQAIKMATTVVAVLPIACVYPFLQRHFVSGITSGAVKE